MQLNKLPDLVKLKKSLKSILRSYKELHDIILFGSTVKGKELPGDIDVALVVDRKNPRLVSEIKKLLPSSVHLEVLVPTELYTSSIGLSILAEGFSIKKNDFLKKMLGIKPMKIYSYSLKRFEQIKKVQFNRALNKIIKRIEAEKLGAGTVLVPMDQSAYFDEFLSVWELEYVSRKWNIF